MLLASSLVDVRLEQETLLTTAQSEQLREEPSGHETRQCHGGEQCKQEAQSASNFPTQADLVKPASNCYSDCLRGPDYLNVLVNRHEKFPIVPEFHPFHIAVVLLLMELGLLAHFSHLDLVATNGLFHPVLVGRHVARVGAIPLGYHVVVGGLNSFHLVIVGILHSLLFYQGDLLDVLTHCQREAE